MKKLQNNFTKPEQSKRLFELGVPRWSADEYRDQKGHRHSLELILDVELFFQNFPDYLPCWSVGRLMEIAHICSDSTLSYKEEANVVKMLTKQLNELRNPWISVKERLPEDDDLVLTIYWVHKDFYSIELSSYNPETREWDCGEFGYRISHWMPIPELPKGGEA